MDSSVIEGRSLNLRVANRSIYPLWALLLAGLSMLAVAVVLFLPGVSETSGVEASVLATAGFACVGFAGLRIVYLKFSALYTVTPDAITARYGLIARKSHQIQVAHVRSISVTQSLVGRLFGYGDLEFSSAGSDESEIVFKSVSRPMQTKEMVSKMLGKDRSRTTHD